MAPIFSTVISLRCPPKKQKLLPDSTICTIDAGWQGAPIRSILVGSATETLKCPLDLWLYQELLVRIRPDVVVETGTWYGGSALYLAMVLDQIGHGQVITVDIQAKPNRPEHPRIRYLAGSSTDPAIIADIEHSVGGDRAMVILDSDHHAPYVYDEIVAYCPLVQAGDYLIVEDTNVNGRPAYPDFGPGPMEAVDRFLSENDEFAIDERCERFLMTLNPRGYLRRSNPRKPADYIPSACIEHPP